MFNGPPETPAASAAPPEDEANAAADTPAPDSDGAETTTPAAGVDGNNLAAPVNNPTTPTADADGAADGGEGGGNASDTASEDGDNNSQYYPTSEPRPSQRLRDAKVKMDAAYESQEAARHEVNRLTKELETAVSYLEERTTEYKSECEAFRLVELGDPSQWNTYYKRLCDYKEKYGHTRVPFENKDDPELAALGRWVRNQRVRLNTPSRIESLNQIGFIWDLNAYRWEEKFNELSEHKEKYGTIQVERIKNEPLQAWIRHQRKEYRLMLAKKNSMMTEEKLEKLRSIGFVFNPDYSQQTPVKSDSGDGDSQEAKAYKKDKDENWEKTYQELVTFQKENGNCNMYKQKEGVEGKRAYVRAASGKLVTFCAQQRKEYKKLEKGEKSSLTPERKKKLDAVGFITNYRKNNGQMKKPVTLTPEESNENWESMYQELVEYQKEHGHCNMYKRKDDDPNGHWVRAARPQLVDFSAHQRKEHKKFKNGEPSEMTQERFEKLNAIGFAFTRLVQNRELTKKRKREEEALAAAVADLQKNHKGYGTEAYAAAEVAAAAARTATGEEGSAGNSYYDLDSQLHGYSV